jgi:CHASE3 domain sensor protein
MKNAAQRQILGLLLIAAFIFTYVLIRYWRVIDLSAR